MEHRPLDPYEQQLLKVFNSYDIDNCGSLNKDGLTQLCKTLQLEEYGNDLIECLLNGTKNSRATFLEFRDALLALLGNIQNRYLVVDEIIFHFFFGFLETYLICNEFYLDYSFYYFFPVKHRMEIS